MSRLTNEAKYFGTGLLIVVGMVAGTAVVFGAIYGIAWLVVQLPGPPWVVAGVLFVIWLARTVGKDWHGIS